ncbi:MAG: hypothetical protein IT210_17965 [Armatimonadetes bacterium]|nr:hypothetical protein [Armatimonadota bacterium]
MEHQRLTTDPSEGTLYDAQAVQKIVSLAAEIQHKRSDLMTAADLERLGADMGLDVEAVRKAVVLYAQERTKPATPLAAPDIEAIRQATATYDKVIALHEQEKACRWQEERSRRRTRFLTYLLSAGAIFMAANGSTFPLSLWLVVTGVGLGGWLRNGPVGGATVGFLSSLLYLFLRQPRHSGIELLVPPFMTALGAAAGLASRWWKSPARLELEQRLNLE